MSKMNLTASDSTEITLYLSNSTIELFVVDNSMYAGGSAYLSPAEARELITMLTAAIAEAEKEK